MGRLPACARTCMAAARSHLCRNSCRQSPWAAAAGTTAPGTGRRPSASRLHSCASWTMHALQRRWWRRERCARHCCVSVVRASRDAAPELDLHATINRDPPLRAHQGRRGQRGGITSTQHALQQPSGQGAGVLLSFPVRLGHACAASSLRHVCIIYCSWLPGCGALRSVRGGVSRPGAQLTGLDPQLHPPTPAGRPGCQLLSTPGLNVPRPVLGQSAVVGLRVCALLLRAGGGETGTAEAARRRAAAAKGREPAAGMHVAMRPGLRSTVAEQEEAAGWWWRWGWGWGWGWGGVGGGGGCSSRARACEQSAGLGRRQLLGRAALQLILVASNSL